MTVELSETDFEANLVYRTRGVERQQVGGYSNSAYHLAGQDDAKADIEFPRVHDEGVGRGCALRMRADDAVGWGYVEAPSGSLLAQRKEIQCDGDVCEKVEGTVGVFLVRQEILCFAVVCVTVIHHTDGVITDCALLQVSAERHADIEATAARACYGIRGPEVGRQRKVGIDGTERFACVGKDFISHNSFRIADAATRHGRGVDRRY